MKLFTIQASVQAKRWEMIEFNRFFSTLRTAGAVKENVLVLAIGVGLRLCGGGGGARGRAVGSWGGLGRGGGGEVGEEAPR